MDALASSVRRAPQADVRNTPDARDVHGDPAFTMIGRDVPPPKDER